MGLWDNSKTAWQVKLKPSALDSISRTYINVEGESQLPTHQGLFVFSGMLHESSGKINNF